MAKPAYVASSLTTRPIGTFASTMTLTHDCGTGAGRMVVAYITTDAVLAGLTVTAVTVGGVAMTEAITRGNSGTEPLQAVYYLAGGSLPTGAQTVSVTLSSGSTKPALFAFNISDTDGGDLSLSGATAPARINSATQSIPVTKTALQSIFAIERGSEDNAGTAAAPTSLCFTTDWFPAIATASGLGLYQRTDSASGSVTLDSTWTTANSNPPTVYAIGWAVSTTSGADATPPTMPSAPTVGTVTASSIQINWAAGSDNVAVTSYETSPDGSTWTDRGNVLTYTFTGLTASTSYTLRVRAKDAAGNTSTPVSVTQSTNAPSGDVTAPVLTGSITFSGVTATGAVIDWPPATDNVGITGYDYSLDAGATWTEVLTDQVTVSGLSPSTTYQVRVRAKDAAGNLSSPVLSGSVTTSASGGTLTSSPLKNNTGTVLAAIAFEAYVSNQTSGALVIKKTGLTSSGGGVVAFTDAGLLAGTSYRVVWRRTDTGAEGLETLTAT